MRRPKLELLNQEDVSQIIDSQSGLESGIGITLAALSGINRCRGPSMMAFANFQSYEKLVIDNSICGILQ